MSGFGLSTGECSIPDLILPQVASDLESIQAGKCKGDDFNLER